MPAVEDMVAAAAAAVVVVDIRTGKPHIPPDPLSLSPLAPCYRLFCGLRPSFVDMPLHNRRHLMLFSTFCSGSLRSLLLMFEGTITDTRPTDIPTIVAMVAVTVEAVTMVLIATQVEAMVGTGCPISELVYRSRPGVSVLSDTRNVRSY